VVLYPPLEVGAAGGMPAGGVQSPWGIGAGGSQSLAAE